MALSVQRTIFAQSFDGPPLNNPQPIVRAPKPNITTMAPRIGANFKHPTWWLDRVPLIMDPDREAKPNANSVPLTMLLKDYYVTRQTPPNNLFIGNLYEF